MTDFNWHDTPCLMEAIDKPPSRRRGYIYVNNRLEGNAPRTLAALIQRQKLPSRP